MRGIMHGFPELLEIRPQVQAVPFRLLHQRKTLVAKWQIVVQAAHADGLVFGHQAIDQKTPRLLVTHQRIAVVGKRQRYEDRKSTRLNSSHITISYAVFCLKKKNIEKTTRRLHQPNKRPR